MGSGYGVVTWKRDVGKGGKRWQAVENDKGKQR